MTRVVRLTGAIGSGKSTVGAMLAELGATIVDADRIVPNMEVVSPPIQVGLTECLLSDISENAAYSSYAPDLVADR